MASWEEDEDEPGAIKSSAASDRLDREEQQKTEGDSAPTPEAQAASNGEVKVDTVEEGASDDDVKNVGDRKLLALFSHSDTSPQQAANQRRSLTLLEAKGITYEKFIGSDPENEVIRDELFRISGIKENYPQFFLVAGADTTYVGDFEKIQHLNDEGMLTNEMLGVTEYIAPPQDEEKPGPAGALGAGILHHEEEIIEDGDEEILHDDEEEVIQDEEEVIQDEEEVIQDEEDVIQDEEDVIQDEEEVIQDEEEEVLESDEEEVIYHEGDEEIIEDDDDESVEENFFVDEDGNEIYEEEQVEEKLAAVGSDNSPEGPADENCDTENKGDDGEDSDDGRFTGGAVPRNPDETADVENQNHAVPEKAPREPKKKEEEKEPNCFRRTFSIPVLFWILLLIGAGIAVGVSFALTDDDDDNNDNNDKGTTTKSPQGEKTTAFDGSFGNGFCDFPETAVPSTIDQCACFGEIRTIPQDVQDRYNMHLETFILTIYAEYTEAINSCAPENQALLWLASANDYEFDNQERRQRFTLAVLIASMDGAMWTSRQGWLGVNASCLWTRVVCNDQDQVTSLDLSANNVGGTLHREIVALNSLETLSFSQNRIEGPIPPELFLLQKLRIVDLSFNTFTGSLPSTVPRAGVLEVLNVERNSLSGNIPAEIRGALALSSLNLGFNRFAGGVPLGMFDLPDLANLQLNGNELTGTIPLEVSRASRLTSLSLGPNFFTGSIQSTISKLSNLVGLTIAGTGVTGSIPTSFGALPRLKKLNLSGNSLGFEIPVELSDIATLQELRLNDNLLTGSVPVEFSKLASLIILTLDGNLLGDVVNTAVCELRNGVLDEFVVDCPSLINDISAGVVCGIPTCCSSCRSAPQLPPVNTTSAPV